MIRSNTHDVFKLANKGLPLYFAAGPARQRTTSARSSHGRGNSTASPRRSATSGRPNRSPVKVRRPSASSEFFAFCRFFAKAMLALTVFGVGCNYACNNTQPQPDKPQSYTYFNPDSQYFTSPNTEQSQRTNIFHEGSGSVSQGAPASTYEQRLYQEAMRNSQSRYQEAPNNAQSTQYSKPYPSWDNPKQQYIDIVYAAADKYGVPRDLAYYIAQNESVFDPNALSNKGARGIMQVMPSVLEDYNCFGKCSKLTLDDLYIAQYGADVGCWQLKRILKVFGENASIDIITQAYHDGIQATQEKRQLGPEAKAYSSRIKRGLGR